MRLVNLNPAVKVAPSPERKAAAESLAREAPLTSEEALALLDMCQGRDDLARVCLEAVNQGHSLAVAFQLVPVALEQAGMTPRFICPMCGRRHERPVEDPQGHTSVECFTCLKGIYAWAAHHMDGTKH